MIHFHFHPIFFHILTFQTHPNKDNKISNFYINTPLNKLQMLQIVYESRI